MLERLAFPVTLVSVMMMVTVMMMVMIMVMTQTVMTKVMDERLLLYLLHTSPTEKRPKRGVRANQGLIVPSLSSEVKELDMETL